MAVLACASAPPAPTRALGAAARAPARSSLSRPAVAGRPSGPQVRRSDPKNQARALAAPVRRAALQRPSRRPFIARADVNWDAFRSGEAAEHACALCWLCMAPKQCSLGSVSR